MSNSYGKIFRITTFGESHGQSVGVVVDGCPAGLEITPAEIQLELDRRRPGQSNITTQRKEEDEILILSGLYENKTTGTPIAMMVNNKNPAKLSYTRTVRWRSKKSINTSAVIASTMGTARGNTHGS